MVKVRCRMPQLSCQARSQQFRTPPIVIRQPHVSPNPRSCRQRRQILAEPKLAATGRTYVSKASSWSAQPLGHEYKAHELPAFQVLSIIHLSKYCCLPALTSPEIMNPPILAPSWWALHLGSGWCITTTNDERPRKSLVQSTPYPPITNPTSSHHPLISPSRTT